MTAFKDIMIVDRHLDLLALKELITELPETTIISIRKGGISALEYLYDCKYSVDAILIDLALPDIDGVSLTEQIRRNEKLRQVTKPYKRPIQIFWLNELDITTGGLFKALKMNNVAGVFLKPYDLARTIWTIKDAING